MKFRSARDVNCNVAKQLRKLALDSGVLARLTCLCTQIAAQFAVLGLQHRWCFDSEDDSVENGLVGVIVGSPLQRLFVLELR